MCVKGWAGMKRRCCVRREALLCKLWWHYTSSLWFSVNKQRRHKAGSPWTPAWWNLCVKQDCSLFASTGYATVELSSSTLVVRHHLFTFVYSSRGGLEKALMVLPFQQVVYGLEQKGSALVGKPTLPQALLTNWKKRKQRHLSRFFFFFFLLFC